MKPILLIIILSVMGICMMQEINHPKLSIQSVSQKEWVPLIPSSTELIRWQW